MTAANGNTHGSLPVRPVRPEDLAELRASAANAVQDDKPVVFFVPGYTVRLGDCWTLVACMRLQNLFCRAHPPVMTSRAYALAQTLGGNAMKELQHDCSQ